MFLSRFKQHVVIISTGLVLILIMIVFWYLPVNKQKSDIKSKSASLNSLISQAKQKQQQLPELQKELTEYRSSLLSYELALPYDTQLGDFLGEVAGLMDLYGLTEQQISPQKEIKTQQLNCIAVEMKCKGGLSQVRKFYDQLQKLDRAIRVAGFRLVNDDDLTGEISMETKVIIYFRGEQA